MVCSGGSMEDAMLVTVVFEELVAEFPTLVRDENFRKSKSAAQVVEKCENPSSFFGFQRCCLNILAKVIHSNNEILVTVVTLWKHREVHTPHLKRLAGRGNGLHLRTFCMQF